MQRLNPLPDSFAGTRDTLKRVAVHIVARSRQQATGRFGMRVTPGGFGTPEFGDDLTRVRVAGSLLIRESGGTAGSASAAVAVGGSSLGSLAAFAGVDLSADLDVGHDTPLLGDIDELLLADHSAAEALGHWFGFVAAALDGIVGTVPPAAAPTLTQLWPEHFDVALDLAATPDRRVNLGGSPGDGFHPEPYLYVGPWSADRPGDPSFWNAPFGAALTYSELLRLDDPQGAAAVFFRRGIELLGT